jgi:mRNA-degrading endonuclease toxin of MazEF toxin-antitoxin module
LPTVLVVPVTSQQDALRFPGTVLIESTKENGLRQDSVALVFQLTAIDIRHVTNRLGVASEEVMENIWQAFDDLTGRG